MYKPLLIIILFGSLLLIACSEGQTILPNPQYFDSLKISLNQAIADSAFPGCAISVGYRGKLIFEQSFGNFTYDPHSSKVEVNSIFDLASVTKVVATTTISMILYDQGRLNLDWRVVDIVTAFQGNDKEKVTKSQMLNQTSGLTGWIRFYL